MDSSDQMVRIEHLYKTFNKDSVNEVVLFTDFSLRIPKEEFVTVVGSNGSGKTTLLNILCGSIDINGGRILLKDRDISRMKEYERASGIGRVFQDPAKGTCPTLTILENMSLADNKNRTFGFSRGVNKRQIDFYRASLELLKLGLEDKIHLQWEIFPADSDRRWHS